MDGRDRDMRVYGADGVGLREARSDMGRGTPHPKPSTLLLSCLPGTQLLNKCNIGLNCSSLSFLISDFPFLIEFNVSCHLIIVLVTFATVGFTNVWLFVQLSLEH